MGLQGDSVVVRLKVTSKGQVTLKKEVLDHLHVKPGDEIEVDLLPKAKVSVQALPKGKIEDLFGMFKNKTGRSFSIAEINEAVAAGWAGEVES
jgi:bifunctional DNA-binding transcriptional regulator/antitoxin component of YhaV-PrlF toxin-antitoxin module